MASYNLGSVGNEVQHISSPRLVSPGKPISNVAHSEQVELFKELRADNSRMVIKIDDLTTKVDILTEMVSWFVFKGKTHVCAPMFDGQSTVGANDADDYR